MISLLDKDDLDRAYVQSGITSVAGYLRHFIDLPMLQYIPIIDVHAIAGVARIRPGRNVMIVQDQY